MSVSHTAAAVKGMVRSKGLREKGYSNETNLLTDVSAAGLLEDDSPAADEVPLP
jgi:hypothetical protein